MKIVFAKPQKAFYKLLIALFLVGVAGVLRILILPVDGRVVYSTLYPAVALAGLICGYRYGVLATLLGGLFAYFYLLPPFETFKILNAEQLTGLVTYLVSSIIISLSFSRYSDRIEFNLFKPQSVASRFLSMVLIVLAAFALRLIILPTDSRVIYSTFYPAIALATLVAGFEIGVVGVLISGILAYFFLLTPFGHWKLVNFEQGIGLVTFFIASGIICFSLREVLIRGQKIKKINEALQDMMTSTAIGKTLQQLVEVVSSSMEMRDPYTAGHQRRVAELGVAIANKMNLPERNIQGVRLAGLIHDLGKMSVPIEILTKPGKLTDSERSLIARHPQEAYDSLKTVDAPWPLADIVVQHHERMDGSGYPNGLKGNEILTEARILAVSDVVEAMSAMRPYREGLGVDAALKEIKQHAGTKYDPDVVKACVALFERGEFKWQTQRHG